MPESRIVRTLLRLMGPLWRRRRFALWSEQIFWGFWIRRHRPKIAELVDPDRRFPEELEPYLEGIDRDPVKVLEVGAGPFGSIGQRHPTKRIEVTATDLLAAQYDRMLARHELHPPVRTIYADAEHLTDQFGAGSFDLVYATNCVDHMERPLSAIREMVSVVRPGGHVVLLHEIDEGARQDYAGLHQWNLNADGDHFIVWNRKERHDVTALLRGTCEVTAVGRGEMVYAVIRKR